MASDARHGRRAVDNIDGLGMLSQHDERPYSFVDATSFALWQKLRIEEALAFDGKLAAAGFVEFGPGLPA